MNYKKVKICLDFGYRITIADISAASVSPKMHALLLDNLPPIRLTVLAARAVRAQMLTVSGNINVTPQINGLLEDGLWEDGEEEGSLITDEAFDLL